MTDERRWSALYRAGAVVAIIGVAALLFDVVLSMMPGWGTGSVPATIPAWLAQFDTNPWLALRNLDLLNVTVSVITVPMYIAIAVSLRRCWHEGPTAARGRFRRSSSPRSGR